jgi:hypothetical protein
MPHESGASSTPWLLRPASNASGILGRPVKPGDDSLGCSPISFFKQPGGHAPTLSRRDAPELCGDFRPQETEGAGKAGCPLHPQPRVRIEEAHERSHHRFTGFTRPSLRNGFNGFLRALPGDRAFLPPSPPRSLLLKNLTPASGRQDHTTSPSAIAALVLRRHRVHCIPPQRS